MRNGWVRYEHDKVERHFFWGMLHHPNGPAAIYDNGRKYYTWFDTIYPDVTSDLEWLMKAENFKAPFRCIVDDFGNQNYELNNRLHREDGPARITYRGSTYFYLYGMQHREDGPAVTYYDKRKQYHLYGVYYPKIETDKEWSLKVKEIKEKYEIPDNIV